MEEVSRAVAVKSPLCRPAEKDTEKKLREEEGRDRFTEVKKRRDE